MALLASPLRGEVGSRVLSTERRRCSPPRSAGRSASPRSGLAGWGVSIAHVVLTAGIGSTYLVVDSARMRSPETYQARYLRNNMTETERRVWSRLRSRQLGGYKFRRQVPVGPYFIDFLCISESLVVEVDGAGHEAESDDRKTRWLEAHGYRVLRIPVVDVDESMDDVIHGIYLELTEPSLPVRIPPPGVLATRAGRPPRGAGRRAAPSFLLTEPQPALPRGAGRRAAPSFLLTEPQPALPRGAGR
jgi:very-short-patch-repair endonuclease